LRKIVVNVMQLATGHVLGIGTLWDYKNLTGSDSMDCPYYGANTNAEFAAISECPVVPTELGGGDGTRCGHWDESCLQHELMTGHLSGTKQSLSRITIGSWEDLGYVVDYSVADPFESGDLGYCSGCRRELSVFDYTHGETRQLGLNRRNTKPRQLSEPLRKHAMEQGLDLLKSASVNNVPEGCAYVGDKVISVIVQDGDSMFSVIVKNE
jgi:hypothetical protein